MAPCNGTYFWLDGGEVVGYYCPGSWKTMKLEFDYYNSEIYDNSSVW